MIAPIDKVRDEGNCWRVTDREEEACGEMRKRRVCISLPPVSHLVQAARLQTEMLYKAGSTIRYDYPYPIHVTLSDRTLRRKFNFDAVYQMQDHHNQNQYANNKNDCQRANILRTLHSDRKQ